MMSKILKPKWFLLLGITSLLAACSPGEDDPAFGFLNRTAKLSGDWELTEMDGETTSRWNSNSETRTVTYRFEDGEMRINDDGDTETESFSYDISFEKENTYERTILSDGYRSEDKGLWAWSHKIESEDIANREALTITGLEYISDDDYRDVYRGIGVPPDQTFVLKELRKDKMVVYVNWENTEDDGYRYTTESTMVFEKK